MNWMQKLSEQHKMSKAAANSIWEVANMYSYDQLFNVDIYNE